jgi:hypothetical protein
MANNRIDTIPGKDGHEYRLTINGKSAVYSDRSTAYGLLLLHEAKESGRQLKAEEQSALDRFFATAK